MINKKHLIGGLNTNDAEVLLDPKEYLGALNIRFVTAENGAVGRISNIEGNTLVSTTINNVGAPITFTLPAGTNTIIGSQEDLPNQRLFFFNKNSNGNHGIYCYDDRTGYIYTVVLDNKIVGGLQFSNLKNIHSIGVLGSILTWTDNTIDPKSINADAAMAASHPSISYRYQYTFPIAYESSTVINRPPIQALLVDKGTDSGYSGNYIRNASFKFLYQYNYKDYQISALSAHSAIDPYLSTTSTYNYLAIKIPFTEQIPDDVQSIDICVRINDETNVTIVKTFDRDVDNFAAHNSGTTQLAYNFYNDIIGVTVDSNQSGTAFHAVPLKSNTLAFAKNRLFLANNTSGYDTPKTSSLAVATGSYSSPGASSVTAQWKYATLQYRTSAGANATKTFHYVYDSTATYNVVYFYSANVNSVSPPASFNQVDADVVLNSEANLVYWYMSHYAAPGGGTWDYTYSTLYTNTGSTTVVNFSTTPLDGVSFFKTGSTYRVSISFYDRFRRKCGVVDLNNKINIPSRVFNQTSFIGNINWTLSNTSAVSEIPSWAYYYQIHITKSLLTRFFIQDYTAGVYYTIKTTTGGYDHSTTVTYSGSVYAVTIDLSRLNAGARGYTYQEGDLVRLTKSDGTTYTLQVLGQDGKYLMLSATNVGTVSSSTEMLYEIYTPYQSSATEPYYESGAVMKVINPTTSLRSYGVTSGSLVGDVYPRSVTYGSNVYTIETMNPNFAFWQDWQTNTGWVNIVTKLGSTVKNNSVQFSDPIIPGTQVNGLNAFQPLNETELPFELNGVQKLVLTSKVQSEGTVMLAVGVNETSSLYLGESQIFDASGDSFIAKSTGVIGQVNTLRGSYGTVNPESVFGWQGAVYWFDANKGEVIRYDNNGLFPISDYKMSKYFVKLGEAVLESKDLIHMGIDPYHGEVLINIPQSSVVPTNAILTDMTVSSNNYSYTPAGATLSVTPGTLSSFNYTFGLGPSVSQSFSYTASNVPLFGSVTITGSTNYEISFDNINFTGSLSSVYSGISDAKTVYVRLKSGIASATYNETISLSATGGATNSVSVNGSVSAVVLTPVLATSSTSLAGFGYVTGSGPSTAQSFTVSASNLSPSSGSITITASANYEVSVTSSTSGYSSSSVTLAYTGGGSLPINTVYVRLKSGLSVASYNGEHITVSGGGASSVNVNTSGIVTAVLVALTSWPSCGYGITSAACLAMAYGYGATTLYSSASTIAVGVYIYLDAYGGTPITGQGYVFIDGYLWTLNTSTGAITSFVIPQP